MDKKYLYWGGVILLVVLIIWYIWYKQKPKTAAQAGITGAVVDKSKVSEFKMYVNTNAQKLLSDYKDKKGGYAEKPEFDTNRERFALYITELGEEKGAKAEAIVLKNYYATKKYTPEQLRGAWLEIVGVEPF